MANQLFFASCNIAPELRIFGLPSTESIRVADFIYALKEKQEILYKMMTILITSSRYYNSFAALSLSDLLPQNRFSQPNQKFFFVIKPSKASSN